MNALVTKKTSPNGVFGIKAHYHQLVEAFGDTELVSVHPRDLGDHFPNLHLVHIKRLDRVGQAVSFALATQTEQWTSAHEPPATPPRYDHEQIRSLLDWIEREEGAWERFIAACTAPVFRVVYEDFIEAIEETITAVMEFLEIEVPPGFAVPAPTLARQADELNAEWVARFAAQAARA
jgi:LPS sulfotransferase NodH